MDLRVHLKICEACGCLWYRAQAETTVYCFACQQRLKEFPTPKNGRGKGRPRKTILPTVYAVQHSPHSGWDGSLPTSRSYGRRPQFGSHPAIPGGAR
jgi:hypothetical protein